MQQHHHHRRRRQNHDAADVWHSRLQIIMGHVDPSLYRSSTATLTSTLTSTATAGTVSNNHTAASSSSSSSSSSLHAAQQRAKENQQKAVREILRMASGRHLHGADVLSRFSPLVTGNIKKSIVTYLSPHRALAQETLQAGVLLVAHPRADVRREFINRLCRAAVEKSALVYAIAPSGGVNVNVEGVYKLATHPTLSRRAILNAMLRHGAHLLVFGTISTRDDIAALMDATYTGYHCVAEIYGENAHDVLSRLDAIGVDVSTLPANTRIVVPR